LKRKKVKLTLLAGPLGRALGAVVNGRAPQEILDTWAESRRSKWLSYTNEFSIENKRMVQRGGYSEDPAGIWKMDEVSAAQRMDRWLRTATPEKKAVDEGVWEALKDKDTQLASRMKQWEIAMDPLWMSKYEDPEVTKARVALRPVALDRAPTTAS
jgi:hypothetical protein